MKNPAWQAAEDERLAAEEKYATYMKSRDENPDKDRKQIEALNAEIEAANKKVRANPENIDEE